MPKVWGHAVIVCDRGISQYVLAIFKARLYVHCNYAKVVVTVLNSSVDEALGCVHLHWRIAGLHQKLAFMFWRFAPFQFKKTAASKSEWANLLSVDVYLAGFVWSYSKPLMFACPLFREFYESVNIANFKGANIEFQILDK